MGSSRWCLVALTTILPLSIRVSAPADSVASFVAKNGTRFEVLGGTGEYAFITRGCEGQVVNTVPGAFRDVGGRIEHSVGHGMTLGVRGGVVHDDIAGLPEPVAVTTPSGPIPGTRNEIDNAYVNPYFTYEQTTGSVGFGWVAHQHEFVTTSEQARLVSNHSINDFSAHLRLGRTGHYFAIRWMDGGRTARLERRLHGRGRGRTARGPAAGDLRRHGNGRTLRKRRVAYSFRASRSARCPRSFAGSPAGSSAHPIRVARIAAAGLGSRPAYCRRRPHRVG